VGIHPDRLCSTLDYAAGIHFVHAHQLTGRAWRHGRVRYHRAARILNYSYSGHRAVSVYSAHRAKGSKTYSKNLNLMVGFHTDDVHDVLNTDT
jgi:hypothetical protein